MPKTQFEVIVIFGAGWEADVWTHVTKRGTKTALAAVRPESVDRHAAPLRVPMHYHRSHHFSICSRQLLKTQACLCAHYPTPHSLATDQMAPLGLFMTNEMEEIQKDYGLLYTPQASSFVLWI